MSTERESRCGAAGYDDRDRAILAEGHDQDPWRCTLPPGHEGDHDAEGCFTWPSGREQQGPRVDILVREQARHALVQALTVAQTFDSINEESADHIDTVIDTLADVGLLAARPASPAPEHATPDEDEAVPVEVRDAALRLLRALEGEAPGKVRAMFGDACPKPTTTNVANWITVAIEYLPYGPLAALPAPVAPDREAEPLLTDDECAALAAELHRVDCGCSEFGDPWGDEDDRYIRAAMAASRARGKARADRTTSTTGEAAER